MNENLLNGMKDLIGDKPDYDSKGDQEPLTSDQSIAAGLAKRAKLGGMGTSDSNPELSKEDMLTLIDDKMSNLQRHRDSLTGGDA